MDVLLADVREVLGVGPVGVHVLDGAEDAVRIVRVVVAVDVLSDLGVKEPLRHVKVGQHALVVVYRRGTNR